MKKIPLFSFLVLSFIPFFSSAQELKQGEYNDSPTILLEEKVSLSDEIVDCFEYYTFNSIQTDIISTSTIFNAKETINFNGFIYNNNPYPVVEGQLYIKIFKKDYEGKNPNGPDVVDQFVALEDISISANGVRKISFNWKIPEYIESGNYRIASFFVVDGKFNLLGLNFTDDIVGNTFDFEIVGKDKIVYFDKSSVKINDKKFYFAAFPPQISQEEKAIIETSLVNNTDVDENISVITKIYKWDSMHPSNFVREISNNVFVKSNSSSTLGVEVGEIDSSVFFIIEEMQYKDTKSILNIRFVRPEVDKIRLNFPSIMEYPIKENSTSTIFSCMHNSGTSQVVHGGKLKLEVINKLGSVVGEYIYDGAITGSMMAVKSNFFSKKELKDFSIRAQLWQDDKIVDESVLKYSCKKITPGECGIGWLWYALGVIVLLIVIILFIIKNKKQKNEKK